MAEELNPVLQYADSYRDMARQGVTSVSVWSIITDLERNIAPLCIAKPKDAARAQLPSQGGEQCKWVRDEDTGAYETQCGTTWHLMDGGEPEEHGQYFCHHCGKQIDDEVEEHE